MKVQMAIRMHVLSLMTLLYQWILQMSLMMALCEKHSTISQSRMARASVTLFRARILQGQANGHQYFYILIFLCTCKSWKKQKKAVKKCEKVSKLQVKKGKLSNFKNKYF